MKYSAAISSRVTWLAGIMVLAILFFGLKPKDFRGPNGIEWLEGPAGISISRYGIVYADLSGSLVREPGEDPAAFSIEMAFKPKSFQDKGFNLILSLHDGKDGDQLIVGQWQSSIIIMNGDDYNYQKRKPRAVITAVSMNPETIFLSIAAGKDGTAVYADGARVRTRNDFELTYPESGNTLLTLGNSIYGRHSWNGEIYGLALYRRGLKEQQILRHAAFWHAAKDFSFAENEAPSLLYLFNENGGDTVLDHGREKRRLHIPRRMPVFKRQFFSPPPPWKGFKPNSAFLFDSAVNLAGFMPLGFALAAWLAVHGRATRRQSVIAALAACFVLSLMIETVQAWMPSRSSSLLDLVLNTGGGLLGALAAKAWKPVCRNDIPPEG